LNLNVNAIATPLFFSLAFNHSTATCKFTGNVHWTKAGTCNKPALDAATAHAKSPSNIGMPTEKISVALVHVGAFENIADETKNEDSTITTKNEDCCAKPTHQLLAETESNEVVAKAKGLGVTPRNPKNIGNEVVLDNPSTTNNAVSGPRYGGSGDATRFKPLQPLNPSNPSRNVEVEGKTKTTIDCGYNCMSTLLFEVVRS